MTVVNHATPTVRTSRIRNTLTIHATATYECVNPTVAYKCVLYTPDERGHVEVRELKKYPGRGAFSNWSSTLVGSDESVVERELRSIVFEAAVERLEEELQTYD